MAAKSKTDSVKDEKGTGLTPEEIEALPYKEWLKVKPDWTERQKKHKYYRSVYLAGPPIDTKYGGEPHHSDKHGMLGYENNQLGKEVHTVKEGKETKYVEVNVVGLCCNCSASQTSFEEDYAENG